MQIFIQHNNFIRSPIQFYSTLCIVMLLAFIAGCSSSPQRSAATIKPIPHTPRPSSPPPRRPAAATYQPTPSTVPPSEIRYKEYSGIIELDENTDPQFEMTNHRNLAGKQIQIGMVKFKGVNVFINGKRLIESVHEQSVRLVIDESIATGDNSFAEIFLWGCDLGVNNFYQGRLYGRSDTCNHKLGFASAKGNGWASTKKGWTQYLVGRSASGNNTTVTVISGVMEVGSHKSGRSVQLGSGQEVQLINGALTGIRRVSKQEIASRTSWRKLWNDCSGPQGC